ncbi:hydroxymethylglutaryl-CoA reductase [Aspergillus ambiguus]|uniref:hydroxymethylglutaryl-CoA reductase n=1 Tax=Aspergillus ambiguus TaxID=176160 RepID=UPI003CCE393E
MADIRQHLSSALDQLSQSTRAKFGHILSELTHITNHNTNHEEIKIENFIGYSTVPVGLAGPLQIHGLDRDNSTTCAPMATTEAALIASCCRGCKAINQSGGVRFHVFSEGMSRAPVFRFQEPNDAIAFVQGLPELEAAIIQQAESTSRRARLKALTPHIIGSEVHLHFDYTCGDAAGQNMVTIATQRVCEWMMEPSRRVRFKISDVQVEGNMSSDKKPSWGSVRTPRGVQVMAWASISETACEAVFGCTAETLYVSKQRLEAGAIRNGMHGNNVNTANILAAIFIAAGQDAASVAEASWSHTVVEYDRPNRCLKASVYFPSLPVGTVGGGTSYPTQQEALQIMKCTGTGGKHRLAGIVASFALALDLSTAAALGNNTFSQSHQRLARPTQVDVPSTVKL